MRIETGEKYIGQTVKEVGKEKTVYYKVTLNLTNLKTGLIVWTNNKELRKTFKKKTIGF